jgi:hypothetical protein
MSKRMTELPRLRAAAALVALLAATTACQDLQVDNLTGPDQARATANPSDVEAYISSAFFPSMWTALHSNGTIATHFPNVASEFKMTGSGQGTLLWWQDIQEPRVRHDNGALISLGNGPHGPRLFWANAGKVASISKEGIRILDTGMKITSAGVDVTPRARAYAELMKGWSLGYEAMIFDTVEVIPDSVLVPGDPNALKVLGIASLVPWEKALAEALASIDKAIAIAQANPTVVNYPSFTQSAFWFQSAAPVTNAQFIQMANTLGARLLVLSARSPADRVNRVDWNRVLGYTANGLTTDFLVQLSTGTRASELLSRTQSNLVTGTTNARLDYRVIGPADQSGNYQKWVASPISTRDRFNITTPDRRITGLTPTSDGAYLRYRADNNGFEVDRGRYLFSAYQYARHALRQGLTGNSVGSTTGTFPLISADENTLLRAEALLRTGNRAGAATAINVTRTRSQRIGTTTFAGLPPVTASGVPQVAGVCVPRLDSGACGDLLAAIRYERMLELLATDNVRGFADSRGWGTLADGTILSWPIPGNALELFGLAPYSYGGVGQPNTAIYAPALIP